MYARNAQTEDEMTVDKDAQLPHVVIAGRDDGASGADLAVVVKQNGPCALHVALDELGEGDTRRANGVRQREHRVHQGEADGDVISWPRHALQEVLQTSVEASEKRLLGSVHFECLLRVRMRAPNRTLHYPSRLVGLADIHDKAQVVFQRRHVNFHVIQHIKQPLVALVVAFDASLLCLERSPVWLWQAAEVCFHLVTAAADRTAHVCQHKMERKCRHVERVLAGQDCGVYSLLVDLPLIRQVVDGDVTGVHLKYLAHGAVTGATRLQLAVNLAPGVRVAENLRHPAWH